MLPVRRSRPSSLARVAMLAAALLLLTVPAAAYADPPDPTAPNQSVVVANGLIGPGDLAILPGTTVTWSNPQDPWTYTFASADGSTTWSLNPGDSYSLTFDQLGDFSYMSPTQPDMAGVIHVVDDVSRLTMPELSRVDALAAMVPDDIRAKGILQVGTDTTYAPNEFVDPADGQIKGWDVDLARAISKVLDIPFNIQTADFAAIIPGLGTRYDLGVSSFTPTEEREKTVDFVTYYQAGEAWFTRVGGPEIAGAADLCGLTVAVQTGTTEESDAWGFMGKKPDGSPIPGAKDNCATAGKPPIAVHSFTKQTEANADVLGGRADVGWADQPVAGYQVQLMNDQMQLSGQACSVAPYGIALPKNSKLTPAITEAIKYLIDKGYYGHTLRSWGVYDGAIPSSAVALNNNASVGPACVPAY